MAESQDYQRGYKAAAEHDRAGLAGALRIYMNGGAGDLEEPLSPSMARQIFASVHGVVAADQEFGAERVSDGLQD